MLEFFAKVDDDPTWFSSKHTGTKRGLARVVGMLCWKGTRNGQGLQILRGNPYLSEGVPPKGSPIDRVDSIEP